MPPREARFRGGRRLLLAALLGGALFASLFAALLVAGGPAVNPYYDAGQPQHRPDGFRNLDPSLRLPPGLGEVLRWQWQRRSLEVPPPVADLSPLPAELDFIRANREAFAATWIGHATVLLQLDGVNLLTDPMFSDRASPLRWLGPKRWQPPGVALAELPRIDVVLISHDHYDHLDEASVRALAAQPGGPPLFVVPLGVERWLAGIGIRNVRRLDWWERTEAGGLTIHLTPAQHWSGRGLTGRNRTLWGGFVVETRQAPVARVYFAGDSGWSAPLFAEIGARFAPIDLALLPIGAYLPRWFMRAQHVDPAEAVQIHRAVGARASLGIHWGSFVLTDEPLDQPLRDLDAARRAAGITEGEFRTLRVGQTWRLDGPDAR